MLSEMEHLLAVEQTFESTYVGYCGKVFNDHTGTFYYDLRTEERVIDLAL